MKKIVLTAIVFYKKLSVALRASRLPVLIYTDCKFYPSCSDYAVESVNKYGALKGLAKSLRRVLKCSPFSKGGIDIP